MKSISICNHECYTCLHAFLASLSIAKLIAFVPFYISSESSEEKNSHKIHESVTSSQSLPANIQFDVNSMAVINGTHLLTSPNSSSSISSTSSSWQVEAVRGIQITATLLIFLVRNPPKPACAINIIHHHIGLKNIYNGAA